LVVLPGEQLKKAPGGHDAASPSFRRKLIFSFDFMGDGSQTPAGSTGSDCRQDHAYAGLTGAVRAEQCVVDVDADGKPRHDPQCQSYTIRPGHCPTGGACTVFATFKATGALGGLSGADALCQTRHRSIRQGIGPDGIGRNQDVQRNQAHVRHHGHGPLLLPAGLRLQYAVPCRPRTFSRWA
jgi:hypothetical protein